MRASIIIPCKEIDSLTEECVDCCKKLDYSDYEIIVLPDEPENVLEGVKLIATGTITPGAKRNIGFKHSSGDIIAFIDSDAYPRRDWLKNAEKYFDNLQMAAVGGPGITPESDSLMQQASGYVFSSFMVGALSNRYKTNKVYESDDIHSCNFIVRRDVIEKISWNEKYWPGEDTLICLGIQRLGLKMIEASDVVVYHHRKPLFMNHLQQASNFALHRGFFAKRFSETSLRPIYFAPSILFLTFLSAPLIALYAPSILSYLSFVFVVYFLFVLISSLRKPKIAPIIWTGIFLTHMVYGFFFVAGLLRGDLER